jgi:spore coat protein U-like protein
MNRILTLLASTAALAALVVAAAPARAANTTGANVLVTATVNATCKMTDATVGFGVYDPNAPADNITGQGNLTVTCTKGITAANITLGGTVGSRVMTGPTPSDTLSYELYSNAGRSAAWGAPGVPVPTTTGAAQTMTVYGRIPFGQYVAAGAYSATVAATLNF